MVSQYMDIKAEEGVIASIFASPEELDLVADILVPEDFGEPRNETIYKAMLAVAAEGTKINEINVLAYLRKNNQLQEIGGTEAMLRFRDLETLYAYDTDVVGYSIIVKDESKKRQILQVARRLHDLGALNNGMTADEAIAQSELLMRQLATNTLKSEALPVGDTLDARIEAIRERMEMPEGTTSGTPSGFIDLDAKTSGWRGGQFIIVAARPGMGKALALDTPILTSTGWKTMGLVEVGDEVFHPSGEPTRVVETSPIRFDADCYEVMFNDGSSLIADAEHEFPVMISGLQDMVISVLTVDQMKTMLNIGKEVRIPGHDAVKLDNEQLYLDDRSVDLLPRTLTNIATSLHNPAQITQYGNLETRLAFLQTAYDTYDGQQLEEDVQQSLNILAATVGRRILWEDDKISEITDATDRFVTSIKAISTTPVKCIQIEHSDHIYLAGANLIPTHNSTLALDFARNAAFLADKTVIFFSLEMGRDELEERLLSAESRVELTKIRSGKNISEEEYASLVESTERIRHSKLIFDDTPEGTLAHFRAVASKQAARPEGLDMIIIDYLQLMRGGGKDRQQEVSEFSRGIKLLAKELNVPIIALSQLNRGPEQRADKKPQLSDLRESGSLEQDADIILFVSRPEYYDPQDRPGQAFLDIAKHRGGPTGNIAVIPLLEYSKFVNSTGRFPAEPTSEEPPPVDPEQLVARQIDEYEKQGVNTFAGDEPPPLGEEPQPAAW